ncbi:MAG TPA: TetR/AcrR family transcriptional regulator [Dehalococcoidia bacterium]|nr:TetR/AcrR family transcriptional regulator [Dehalococcoidia bacterium]
MTIDQSPTRADARANRARLLAAAHEVLRERGPDAEMKEIAERAGVGVGTIYRNFPTKDDLIVAIVTEMVDQIRDNIDSASALDDPIEAIQALLRRGFQLHEHFGDMAAVLGGHMPPACIPLFMELNPVARIAPLVRRGIAAGIFRADLDVELTADFLASSFKPSFFVRRSPDERARAYAGLFLRGMLAHPEAGPA